MSILRTDRAGGTALTVVVPSVSLMGNTYVQTNFFRILNSLSPSLISSTDFIQIWQGKRCRAWACKWFALNVVSNTYTAVYRRAERECQRTEAHEENTGYQSDSTDSEEKEWQKKERLQKRTKTRVGFSLRKTAKEELNITAKRMGRQTQWNHIVHIRLCASTNNPSISNY